MDNQLQTEGKPAEEVSWAEYLGLNTFSYVINMNVTKMQLAMLLQHMPPT